MNENPIARLLGKYHGKKIIVFGAGSGGQTVFYTVDNARAGTSFCGLPVKSPYDLLHEDSSLILVIIGACRDSDAAEMKTQLEGMGLNEGIHFEFSRLGELYAPLDYVDPHLGYNRMDDLMGFKVFGIPDPGAKKIVILGGSTSDHSFGGFKSWPEALHGALIQKGESAVIYNGAIAGYTSGQNLLKLVRDVMPLCPDIVISFEGINDAVQGRVSGHPLVHPYAASTFEVMFQATSKNSISINQELKGITFGVPDPIGKVQAWMRNLRAMNAVCREFGIRFFPFLQPNSFVDPAAITQSSNDDAQIETIREFYREATKMAANSGFVTDATAALNGIADAYFDFVHYSANGAEALAEYVLHKLSDHSR